MVWKSRHLWLDSQKLAWNCRRLRWHFAIGLSNGDSSSGSSKNSLVPVENNQPESCQRSFGSLRETVHALMPMVTSVSPDLFLLFLPELTDTLPRSWYQHIS